MRIDNCEAADEDEGGVATDYLYIEKKKSLRIPLAPLVFTDGKTLTL